MTGGGVGQGSGVTVYTDCLSQVLHLPVLRSPSVGDLLWLLLPNPSEMVYFHSVLRYWHEVCNCVEIIHICLTF